MGDSLNQLKNKLVEVEHIGHTIILNGTAFTNKHFIYKCNPDSVLCSVLTWLAILYIPYQLSFSNPNSSSYNK